VAGLKLVLGLGTLLAGTVLLAACNTAGTSAPVRVAVSGLDCPDMVIRPGGQAHIFYDRTGTTDPSRVRYQATILQLSRECFRTGDMIEVVVHVSGRIVGGPRVSGNTGSAVLQIDVQQGGAVTGRREYTVAASIAPPLFGGDYVVNDALAVPAASVRSTRIVVGLDN
jgi:hypothetical protein